MAEFSEVWTLAWTSGHQPVLGDDPARLLVEPLQPLDHSSAPAAFRFLGAGVVIHVSLLTGPVFVELRHEFYRIDQNGNISDSP